MRLINQYCDLRDPLTGVIYLRGSKIRTEATMTGMIERPWRQYQNEPFVQVSVNGDNCEHIWIKLKNIVNIRRRKQ